MTAYVTLIVKNPLIMPERIFDSINLPLFAVSRSAHERSVRRGAMREVMEIQPRNAVA